MLQIFLKKLNIISKFRSRFHEWSLLKFYLTTTNAKDAGSSVKFDLRYLGQTVAIMTCQQGKTTLSTGSYEQNNKRDFNCTISLAGCVWDGTEARDFRSYFKNGPPIRNKNGNKGNEEHRIESLLLSEFSKTKRNDKLLPNIQPVKIARLRFPMPTPLSASKHGDIKYTKEKGGGIDILTRYGAGRNTNLCIIEVKDENKPEEPASAAIEQAVAYTVFIRELLRSKAGIGWWKLFGFGGSYIPKKLVLHAACAMPYIDDADTSFAGKEFDIDGDTIRLQYIYFQEVNNVIKKIYTSLDMEKPKQKQKPVERINSPESPESAVARRLEMSKSKTNRESALEIDRELELERERIMMSPEFAAQRDRAAADDEEFRRSIRRDALRRSKAKNPVRRRK